MKRKNIIMSIFLILGSFILLVAMFGIIGEGNIITISSGKIIGEPAVCTLDGKVGVGSIESGIAKFYTLQDKVVTNVDTLSSGGLAVVIDNAATTGRFHNVWMEKVIGKIKVGVVTPPGTVYASGGKLVKVKVPGKKKQQPTSSEQTGYIYRVYYAGKNLGGVLENPRLLDEKNYPKDPKKICILADVVNAKLYAIYPDKDFKGVVVNMLGISGESLCKKTISANIKEPFEISGCVTEDKLCIAYEEKGNVQLKLLDGSCNILGGLTIASAKNPEFMKTSAPETLTLTYVRDGNLFSLEVYIDESGSVSQGSEMPVEEGINNYSGAGTEYTQALAISKSNELLLKIDLAEPVAIFSGNIKELGNAIGPEETNVISFVIVSEKLPNVQELKVAFK